jgi:hypothetical protein
MSTSNKIIGVISANQAQAEVYCDLAAELSKLDRKNHKQVSEKGVPLVYDCMITVTQPSTPPSRS